MENSNTLTIAWRFHDTKGHEYAYLVPLNKREIFFGTESQPQIVVAHINYAELDSGIQYLTPEQKKFAYTVLKMRVHDEFDKRSPFKTIRFKEGKIKLQKYSIGCSTELEWWRIAEYLGPMLSCLLGRTVATIDLPKRPIDYKPFFSS
jgi:hypothetical protein